MFKKKDRCPYCKGRVLKKPASCVGVEEDRDVFVCENYFKTIDGYPKCDAYVLAHPPNHKKDNAGKPMGRLSNEYLRRMHAEVNNKFRPIWKDKIINSVWGYVQVYEDNEGEDIYVHVLNDNGEGKSVVRTMDGQYIKVETNRLQTIEARTKAYLWLHTQLKSPKPFSTFSIQDLDDDESLNALNIITNTLKEYER